MAFSSINFKGIWTLYFNQRTLKYIVLLKFFALSLLNMSQQKNILIASGFLTTSRHVWRYIRIPCRPTILPKRQLLQQSLLTHVKVPYFNDTDIHLLFLAY